MYIPDRHKIYQLFSFQGHSKIYPNLDFCFENKPSGNPGWNAFLAAAKELSGLWLSRLSRLAASRIKFLKKIFFVAFISLIYTQTMHIKSITQQHCYDFPKKPYTLAGIEPGSSDPEADAMSKSSNTVCNQGGQTSL
jgi:hypothetical protein